MKNIKFSSRTIFLLQNWKVIFHLLFRTYRFGVNNKWWSDFDSIFGLPFWKRFNIIQRYKEMRLRSAPGIAFVPEKTFIELFPYYSKKRGL
jgi:hypothetical protein